MSLKIIKLNTKLFGPLLVAAAILYAAVTWFFIKWNFVNTIAYRIDPRTPGISRVADWLTEASPSDPQTHLAAAEVYEQTLDMEDLRRALDEYERAAAASPNDYLRWLDLGKARGLNGDAEEAGHAYERAMQLAPNYASVQWAYGNFLIRSGDTAQGFALIAKAAAANADYSRPAIATALQVFDGDIGQMRAAIGDSQNTNAALAAMMASQKRFDEAADAWSRLPAESRGDRYRALGNSLVEQMTGASKFRAAARVESDMLPNTEQTPVVGQIMNGGFESGVKPRNPGLFEWRIAEGSHPQIGLAEGQTHGGQYALFLLFNTFETAAFRDISQTVAVEPGVEYELEVFYKSDLKGSASLKWLIIDPATKWPVAETPVMTPSADWASVKARFKLPADHDGIVIQLAREGCIGPACQMSGRVSFDDISLKR